MLNDKFADRDGVLRRSRSFQLAGKQAESWIIVDATGQVLGRLASQVAAILRGKHRPEFTPSGDAGDHVIVVNAGKVAVTGKKMDIKVYHHHSGYFGSMRSRTMREVMDRDPTEVVRKAIVGMLPHTRLGSLFAKRLRIYAGPEHPHEAQKPETVTLGG